MISLNPRNRQIAQPGMNMGQDRHMKMVGGNGGNQFRHYAGQNEMNQNGYNAGQNAGIQMGHNAGNMVGNCTVRPRKRDVAYLQTQLLIAQKEEVRIQLQVEEFDLMAAAADCEEIEKVNANCILMANLQQTSTSKEHYIELLESTTDTHLVQQNESNFIPMDSSMDPSGGELEQHPATIMDTHAFSGSLYNNLFIEVEKSTQLIAKLKKRIKLTVSYLQEEREMLKSDFKTRKDELYDKLIESDKKTKELDNILVKIDKNDPPVVYDPEETLQLAQESHDTPSNGNEVKYTIVTLQRVVKSKMSLNMNNWSSHIHQEIQKVFQDEIASIVNQVDVKVIHFEKEFFKEAAKFVRDLKSLAKEVDESLDKIKGMRHNLFSAEQFSDLDLEVAFRRNTCFVRNLDGVNLLKENRSTNLYTINLYEMTSSYPICLMARATSTKSWLWHQRLSHTSFGIINTLVKDSLVTGLPKFTYSKDHLCPSCEQGKSNKTPHKPTHVPNSTNMLHLLSMDLCRPIRVESINRKRYVQVIMDDYSCYTWVHFLISKDESPEVIIKFLNQIRVLLQALVINVRTDNGTELMNQVFKAYFEDVGDQTSTVRTPQQNMETGYLVSTCIRSLCYLKNYREDIRKLGTKDDISFFIGYSSTSCAYRVYNLRTKKVMKTMNVTFDELSAMAFEQRRSKPEL
ncbi:retrovirus-related pol polyprotein from transposon TNT 1-94 [Tanacetum coccineum]